GAETAAPVTIGIPREAEPNDHAGTAERLPAGGWVLAERDHPGDVDVFAVTVPAGTYTFETAGVLGSCGLALEEDTELWVTGPGGRELARSGDVDAARLDFCSRVTLTLAAGTYHVSVRGVSTAWLGRYVLQVRAGG
ncbi:MAG TPA: hypothetical protein VHG91_18985, partial [Longimicrobium sp.]|nr:hypothetical protein [Longimicrobium sp.]